MDPAWIVALCALGGAVLGVLAWIGRMFWRIFRRTDQFLEDWNGTAPDRGHEARPGVMERLALLEHRVNDIQSQVHLNSGHSLRDVVTRTEAAVANNTSQLNTVKQVVEELKSRP